MRNLFRFFIRQLRYAARDSHVVLRHPGADAGIGLQPGEPTPMAYGRLRFDEAPTGLADVVKAMLERHPRALVVHVDLAREVIEVSSGLCRPP